jgi:uncharacterized membrane protein
MFAGLIPWLGTLLTLIVIQIWQTLMAALMVQGLQERQIKEHLGRGGQKAEMVQVFLVSIVALVATILVFVLGKVLWGLSQVVTWGASID